VDRDAIGIFDSGVGGLTVMHELVEALPAESFVYLGDTGRYPYGNKSPETVTRYSIENASFLVDKGIKLLVVACNAACGLSRAARRMSRAGDRCHQAGAGAMAGRCGRTAGLESAPR
jgi:glutamate racemase